MVGFRFYRFPCLGQETVTILTRGTLHSKSYSKPNGLNTLRTLTFFSKQT